MNKFLLVSVITVITSGHLFAEPRQHLKDGLAAFDKLEFEEAASQFTAAADSAIDAELDPAVAYFNLANTLAMEGTAEEAVEAYRKALRTEDLTLQGNALFNMGNTQLKQGQVLAGQGQAQEGLQFTEEALKNYQQSILMDPGSMDRKNNFELAVQQKKVLEEMAEQQQQNQDQQGEDENQDQNQDQQNQEPQSGDENQQQDQQDQDQQDQEQQQDQQDQEQQDQEQQQDQQDQREGSEDPSEGNPGEGNQQQAPPPPSEEMTPEEARMLLEALKEEENAKREKVRVQLGRPVQVDKDW